jgi:glycerol kinase
MPEFVGAIDQGTTSTRFMVFDHDGREVARHQLEHKQILPRPGWVEHDPVEILERTRAAMRNALASIGLITSDLVAVGVANQRETTVVWNSKTGMPYANAIVWQDVRSDCIVREVERAGGGELVRERAGLPPSSYFSAGKLRWLLDNVDGLAQAAARGEALFGTVDSWLVWNLTGAVDGGRHVTDVTNASRTMLMGLERLDWDEDLLALFGVPREMLPAIRPSSSRAGFGEMIVDETSGGGVPLSAGLGDQQAAMIGQVCLRPGETKNTYGTGNFLLRNTGSEIVRSKNGLITTVCYQFEGAPAVYALEGSVAVTGAAIQWLRDQLGIISEAAESETLARTVEDSGGVYFVPAFSGLFAPYWRADARGVIVGLSRFNTNAHLARAALEAICYQSKDVVAAMEEDSGLPLEVLKVDGGVTSNELCMQLQADILGVPVSKAAVTETTALGAAYAAGCGVGFWSAFDDLRHLWREGKRWEPTWSEERRRAGHARWRMAVERSLEWETA